MSIKDFLESKTIQLSELKSNFVEVNRIGIDTQKIFGKCYNCDDSCNQYSYNSESWTKIFYCVKCKCINSVIYTDRMGGSTLDVVIIYKDKQ